jgi:hypothetical protein
MNIDLAKDLLMTQENKRSNFNNIARIFPKLSFTVLALQLMLIPTSHAVEILNSKELTSHCLPKDEPAMEVVYKSLMTNYPCIQ